MTCRPCNGQHPATLRTFPAGDTRASLRAARAATEEREHTTAPIHIHYDATTDTFAVVRTEEN